MGRQGRPGETPRDAGLARTLRAYGIRPMPHSLARPQAMLRASREVRMPHTGQPVRLRVGLHSGPATSGVVGERMPRFVSSSKAKGAGVALSSYTP